LLLLSACGQESTTPSADAEAFNLPGNNVLFGLEQKILQDGVVTSVLVSDTAYEHQDARRFELIGVNVTFFTEQGVEAGRLTSQTGEYDLAIGVFVARDNVVLITSSAQGGRHLETEELHYNLRADELWTDKPFTLLQNGRTTTGTSFRTDARFTTWEVTGAEGQSTVSGDGGIRF